MGSRGKGRVVISHVLFRATAATTGVGGVEKTDRMRPVNPTALGTSRLNERVHIGTQMLLSNLGGKMKIKM